MKFSELSDVGDDIALRHPFAEPSDHLWLKINNLCVAQALPGFVSVLQLRVRLGVIDASEKDGPTKNNNNN